VKRFIIIDHSLQDLQGHHYECSLSVAEAAQRRGYKAIIIANKNFSSSLYPDNIQVISVFKVDWFNNSTQQLNSIQKRLKNFINNQEDITFVDWIKNYQKRINYQIFKLKLIQPKTRVFLERVEGSLFRLTQWMKDDINLIKYIPFTNTFWGILKIIWGLIRFSFKIVTKIIYKVIEKLVNIENSSYINSFSKTINALQLTPDDHLFIHTLSIEQLEEILYFLQEKKLNNLPQYHIMLRRDIDDHLVKNAQGIGIKACLTQFYQCKLFPTKVKFYTDTQQLVNRYNSLSAVKLIEIPVPFRQENLQQNISSKVENKPLHLVYLGDARIEKGYLYLPTIVADLWEDYLITKKIRITIQSNFNINTGERGILASRLKLEEYPQDMVNIIKNPMTTEEYYQLLMSADLLVIPYNIDSYRYRTSGVLTESLAAGKPVIVPANTWLASQVDKSRAGIYQYPQEISQTIIKVINNISEYQKKAQKFSLNWCKKHSPDSLIDCLLSKPNFTDNLLNKSQDKEKMLPLVNNPKILAIIRGDNVLIFDSHGQIIISHLQCLSELGYKIYLIICFLDSKFNRDNYNTFEQQIHSILSYCKFDNIWFLRLGNSPQFIQELSQQKYFSNVYHNEITFTRNLIDVNSLLIPDGLINYLQKENLDSIFIDSITNQILVDKIGLNNIPIICQLSDLQSYNYAIINNQEIDQEELKKEFDLFGKVKVFIANHQHQAQKIIDYYPHLLAYNLPSFNNLMFENNLVKNSKIIDFMWGNNKSEYQQIINDTLKITLGDRIVKNNLSEGGKKIAIFYPWGDILERKAGASQRVGLLIDYLQEKGNSVWLFTIGEEKELILDNVHYSFYDQNFDYLELINKVYTHSYSALINTNQLKEVDSNNNQNNQKQEENIQQIAEDWRLSMYNQFRFDDNFKKWIEKIINWADIVILEYPFWGKTVSKICQEKNVKLIITAHDILCQQVSIKSPIYQILLAEEISSLKTANQVVCVSKEDRDFLTQWGINSKVIPNPVNLNLSTSKKLINDQEKWFNFYPWLKENYCLFVGSGHFPNLEAVKTIKQIAFNYREKKSQIPCHFIIIGSCCQDENNDNFMSLGKVDIELLTIVYQQAKLILAPMLSGTGSSLKIMEAMSFGKVILGTKIGFRGYDIDNKIQAVIENDLTKYPDIISQLLMDNELLNYIGKSAENLAKNYDYRQLYSNYLALIEKLK
jgi:glycosyltransferase involved in cell wall biosynthesis